MDDSLPINPSQHPLDQLVNFIKNFKKQLLIFFAFLILIPFIFIGFKNLTATKHEKVTFELTESSPNDQENSFSTLGQPTFVFSEKLGITEKDLDKYFQIFPKISGTWHLEKNGQVVYFSSNKTQESNLVNNLEYDSIYTVLVNKSLRSVDNQVLNKDINISFRTRKNPQFGLEADQKLISAYAGQTVDITFHKFVLPDIIDYRVNSNLDLSMTATIYSATEEQLLKYFSYKEDKRPIYQFSANSFNKQIAELHPKLISNNQSNTYHFSIDGNVFPKTGLYFATVKNSQGSEDFFVVISKHINQVYTDSATANIWVSEVNSGKGISDVKALFYSVKGSPNLLDTITTGKEGLATSEKSETVDFVITHKDDDLAITYTKIYYYRISNANNLQVFSYSDRPVYRPGDFVHYKAVLRKMENGSYMIPSGKFYIKFLEGYIGVDKNSGYKEVVLDSNGTVNFDSQLPKVTAGSYPEIFLATKDGDKYNQIDALSINVESYNKPGLDISVTSLEKEYISSDSAHYTAIAKTNYGQPLANVEFTFRVLGTDYSEIKDRNVEDLKSRVSGYYGAGQEIASGSGKFDQKGVTSISFFASLSNFELSQIATLEITPKINSSPSIGKIAQLIHRGEFALFIDNLNADIDAGISGKISVLNHNNPRQPVNNQPVVITLNKLIGSNKQLIDSQSVNSDSFGIAKYSFQKADVGNYELVAQSKDSRGNTITIRQQIYQGNRQKYTSSEPTYNLKIKPLKDSYKLDDLANLQISANFPVDQAVAILTTSSGNAGYFANSSKIISINQSNIAGSVWTYPLKISKEFGNQVGLDIFTVYKGQVIEGHTDIIIDQGPKNIATTISFDKQIVHPGDTITANITTKDGKGNPVSADNSLAVIDASILQIGQLNGDIFESFYGVSNYTFVTSFNSTTGIATNLGGGAGGCFLAGTKILMGDGSEKSIEDVQTGDKILTRSSVFSNQLTADIVTQTFQHFVTDYLIINNRLNVTGVHRIFLNNAWHQAKDAKIGDVLLDDKGEPIKITSIAYRNGQFAVYNLTTSKYHTFFAEGIYVHNEKGMGPRENFADTAYWNPHIQTDNQGKAAVSFKVPDNLTTFTAQVFSNTQNSQFGQTTAEFISQKDFNIIPTLASYYFQGDKPVINAIVQNSTSSDFEGVVNLTISEMRLNQKQALHISSGDFEVTSFPIDISIQTNNLSFLFELRNNQGKIVDSLLVKKPILSKGNVNSSWISFEGSNTINIKAAYPNLDFNTVNISVVPNIASKIFQNNFYFDYSPSSTLGKKLYAYSYILAQTRDGKISPTVYGYAKFRNDFREAVFKLLASRRGKYWVSSYFGQESLLSLNLWILQGLNQARLLHLLDEVSNISQILGETTQYIKTNDNNQLPNIAFKSASRDDKLLKKWILQEKDLSKQQEPEEIAVKIMLGDQGALKELRSIKLTSADDRYLWIGASQYSSILPVLAMINNGSLDDAEKAIKGLSVGNVDQEDPLSILAGVAYLARKNLVLKQPTVEVSVNKQLVFQTKKDQKVYRYSEIFPIKNSNNGVLAFNTNVRGDLPIYTTLIQIDFQNQGPNNNAQPLFNQVKKLFLLSKEKGVKAKNIETPLKREYRDILTGKVIPEIKNREAGIVLLSLKNPFNKYVLNNNFRYSVIVEDVLSPSFLYLDQSSGNSPQFQSVLNTIFPGVDKYQADYIRPVDYSDQAVFFRGEPPTQNHINLPYVVYKVSSGSYYQPKTSLVFPDLGLIANEK